MRRGYDERAGGFSQLFVSLGMAMRCRSPAGSWPSGNHRGLFRCWLLNGYEVEVGDVCGLCSERVVSNATG